MHQFIILADDILTLDTVEEIQFAQDALRECGIESAPIYAGDAECPDNYRVGRDLLATPAAEVAE